MKRYHQRNPRRGEIWLAIDRDEKHNGEKSKRIYKDSVQGGTRTCIIVSNNTGNQYSPNVEVVYTTTQKKANLPTHFDVYSTPKPSTVLCEEIDTISKKDLKNCFGSLNPFEIDQLNKCLKISIGV